MRAWRVGPVPSEVSLAEVKANSRIMHDDEDLLLQGMIDAAHERAEKETGRVFGEGEWVILADGEVDRFSAPIWPVVSAPAGWTVENLGRDAVLVAGEWPLDRRVVVRAGEPMPHTVKQAVLMIVGHWFDQRNTASAEPMKDVPYGANTLLRMERRVYC